MRPAQFATQCVAFFRIGEGQIKLPEIPEIGDGHAAAEFFAEGTREVADELTAIFRAGGSALLFLDNPATDAPVNAHHGGIDCDVGDATGIPQDGRISSNRLDVAPSR